MSEDIGSLVVRVAMDNSSFQQGVQNLNRKMKVIQSEFKQATAGLKEHGNGLDGLKAKQNMLSKSIDIQSKLVEKYKQKLQESKQTLQQTTQKQVDFKSRLDETKSAYEASKISLGENNEKTKELKKSYKALTKEYSENEAKIRNNTRTLENYSVHLNNTQARLNSMQQELQETANEINRQSSRWNALSQRLETVGNGFRKVGDKMSSIGKGLTMKLTTPLVAIGAIASKVGMDFEAEMDKVQAISGATGENFKKLKAKAEEMGSKTKFSATESAQGLEYMAMAGWKTQDMLEGLPPILNLAIASGEELGTTSDIVTDALTAFRLKAKDAGMFSDVLAAASSNANTNVSMMGQTFQYAAPVAGALGYSVKDTAIAIGLMANAGIKAEKSGTALRGGLTNLVKPTDAMAIAMDKYKLSITDTSGKVKPFRQLISELRDKLGNLDKATQSQVVSTIFGKEAMSGWLAIINASPQDVNKLTTAIDSSKGATSEMAATINSNGKGSILELKSALEELGIKIYEVLKPAIADIVSKLKEWTNKLNNLTPSQKKCLVKIAETVAAIGPLLIVGGKLLSGIGKIVTIFSMVSSAMAVVSTGAVAATPAVGALATAFTVLTGPVGIAIGVIAGLGVAAYKINKHFSQEAVPSINLFAKKAELVAHNVKSANGTIIQSYSQSTTKISEATKKAVGSYMELDKKASKSLMNLNVNSTKFADNAKNTVIKNFSDMVKKSSGKGKELNTKMVKEFSNLVFNTGTLTEANKKAILGKYTSMVNGCSKLTSKQKINTVNTFKKIFKTTTGITKQQKNTLITQYKEMGAQINAGYDKHYKERTAKLRKFFSTDTTLTAQEQTKILAKEKQHNQKMKTGTNEYTKKIKAILEKASKENRQLKADEVKDIEKYQNNMRKNAVKSLSKSEVESKVILERVKSYSTSITTEQASAVIKNAETQHIKSVDQANKQYIETKAEIEHMRDDTHSISKEQADKMLKEAERQKNDSIKKADEQKQEVVKQISEQNSEVIKNIDTSSGKIKTKWQVLKEDVSKKANELKNSVIKSFEEKKKKVIAKCSEIKKGVSTKWNEIVSWFDTLPSKLKNKANNMFEAMKQGIDNKLVSIKESAKNIGTGIKDAFTSIPTEMLEIGSNIIDGLKNGLKNKIEEVKEVAGNVASAVEKKIKNVLSIHSPSRVMEEIGKYTSQGLALGILEDKDKVEKASALVSQTIKDITEGKLSDIAVNSKINDSELKNRLSKQLNWGANNKSEYQQYLNFINKLNKEEVQKSKEYLKEDYENRSNTIQERLRILKNENSVELKNEKNSVDAKLAYYRKLQRNIKDKKLKNDYANKITDLLQYKKKVLDTTKTNQKAQINSLEISKKALDEYYKDGDKLLDKREKYIKSFLKTQENNFKDLMTTYDTAINTLKINTGDLIKDLKNQEAIVVVQSKKVEDLRKYYEKLAYTFGTTSEETIKAREEFENARAELENMSNAIKDATKNLANYIDKFETNIVNSLKKKYEYEQKLKEDAINKDIKQLDTWKDESIKRINDVYDAKINTLEAASAANITCVENEIKALDDAEKNKEKKEKEYEYLNRINTLHESIKFEHNAFNKNQLQNELNEVIVEHEKNLNKEALEDKKQKLEEKINIIKNNTKKEKNQIEQQKKNELYNINKIYSAEKQSYSDRLEELKSFYSDKLSNANLNAEAEKLIMDNNQKQIIELLNSYSDQYKSTGQTLGEKLAEGFRPKIQEIKDMISNINSEISSARSEALDTMRLANKASSSSSSHSSGSNSSRTVNNNNITFNSPKALSASEIFRKTESTLRKLGFGL